MARILQTNVAMAAWFRGMPSRHFVCGATQNPSAIVYQRRALQITPPVFRKGDTEFVVERRAYAAEVSRLRKQYHDEYLAKVKAEATAAGGINSASEARRKVEQEKRRVEKELEHQKRRERVAQLATLQAERKSVRRQENVQSHERFVAERHQKILGLIETQARESVSFITPAAAVDDEALAQEIETRLATSAAALAAAGAGANSRGRGRKNNGGRVDEPVHQQL